EKGEDIRAISWVFVTGEDKTKMEEKTKKFSRLWEKEGMESLISVFLVDEKCLDALDRESASAVVEKQQYRMQVVCHTGR
ncbi:MAG: hypothetical protein Q4G07_11380, partial [Oscillospiraceae bacterium]|nr:hypothetical protein [Oscillospiraceae bacterium]